MTDGPLRFEILGPLRAYRNDEMIDLGPVTQQAVLAVLLLHAGEPVPMKRIVAAIWDHDPPPNAIDVVQRCIGALRRSLDPERTSLLALTDNGYVLRVSDSAIDAGQFRAMVVQARAERHDTATMQVRRALGLWQDEPLTGLTGAIFDAGRARLKQERDTASQLLAAPVPAPVPAPVQPTPPAPPEPTVVEPAPPAPTRIQPATMPPTRVQPVAAPPTRVQHAAMPPTRIEPAAMPPTRVEPAPTRVEPAALDPTRVDRSTAEPTVVQPAAKSEYPEPVDPWDGHDLFPPDPLSMA